MLTSYDQNVNFWNSNHATNNKFWLTGSGLQEVMNWYFVQVKKRKLDYRI